MRNSFTKLSLVFLTSLAISAMAKTPRLPLFTDYTVPVYSGKQAPINYNSDPLAKAFKTRIKESYKQPKPDFAGSYIITSWGCGTSCVNYAMTDSRTGNVYPLSDLAYKATDKSPKTCADIPEADVSNPSEFVARPNSLLIVEQQYCKTDGNGKDIMLNNYLLWQDKTKTFKLLNQAFVDE